MPKTTEQLLEMQCKNFYDILAIVEGIKRETNTTNQKSLAIHMVNQLGQRYLDKFSKPKQASIWNVHHNHVEAERLKRCSMEYVTEKEVWHFLIGTFIQPSYKCVYRAHFVNQGGTIHRNSANVGNSPDNKATHSWAKHGWLAGRIVELVNRRTGQHYKLFPWSTKPKREIATELKGLFDQALSSNNVKQDFRR